MLKFQPLITFMLASSLSISAMAELDNHSSFYWQTYQPDIDSKLYDKCGSVCPEIDYKFINTGNAWLDATVNKAVVNSLSDGNDDNAKIRASVNKFNAIAVPTQAQYTAQLNTNFANLIAANKDIIKARGKDWDKTSPAPVNNKAIPEYLGHKTLNSVSGKNTLELMRVSTYTYRGGAHGISNEPYYVFDMANQKRLTLDDIVLPNQKTKLETLVRAQFIDWIKANGDDPKTYQQNWKFELTQNFTFTKAGLKFVYQPYEISPYALGMPEFTVPYTALNVVIKSDYLN